jgi:hypothetical protein
VALKRGRRFSLTLLAGSHAERTRKLRPSVNYMRLFRILPGNLRAYLRIGCLGMFRNTLVFQMVANLLRRVRIPSLAPSSTTSAWRLDSSKQGILSLRFGVRERQELAITSFCWPTASRSPPVFSFGRHWCFSSGFAWISSGSISEICHP